MKQYKPKPIDTKDIVLPTELNNLIEEMSKNVHKVGRMERNAMMQRRNIRALYHMKNYQKRKRNTTATRLLKPLNSF